MPGFRPRRPQNLFREPRCKDVLLSGVPQVPLETFFTSMFQSDKSTSRTCSAVKAQLVEQGHLARETWSVFTAENTSPKVSMQGLRSIFDTVDEVASGVCGPRRTKLSVFNDRNPSDYLPHAEFQLVARHEKEEPAWFSTVVPWRVDAAYSPRSNREDLVWNCHDVLQEDARRRFTFGITMDADEMRIWFFSRSHNVVSTPFNLTQEPDTLIHLFIAIAFATPERLGYESTMSYDIDEAGFVQFRLASNGVTYITKQLLCDNQGDSICGRGTRVWEAYREDDPDGVSVVIKDLWTSLNVVPEGTQLLDLHARLHTLENSGTPRPPGDYFLTVVSHGFVQTADGVDDHTVDVMLRGHSFQAASANHTPRKHYRIVFKELGVSLDRLQSMSEIFKALADATRALSLLHRLGLVHRDVSAGNILLYNGMGRLTDLEYLESMESIPSRAGLPGIGTPEYTSFEATKNEYTWAPSPAIMPVVKKTVVEGADQAVAPPFRFNPLHDLESILWIAVWAVVYHRRQGEYHARVLERYFPERSATSGIEVFSRLIAIQSGFPRPLPDDPSAATIDVLNLVRSRLLERYIAFEKDFNTQYEALHTPPPLLTPLEVAQDFIIWYEQAGSLAQNALALPGTATKRKAENELSREELAVTPDIPFCPQSKKPKYESAA
ncbi:hypothetical protein DFH06DRAFT_1487807 [Mycena polygramma]|nr:hypothetical protein DFH06DRAFT_1487807 [Mycena polygramma]